MLVGEGGGVKGHKNCEEEFCWRLLNYNLRELGSLVFGHFLGIPREDQQLKPYGELLQFKSDGSASEKGVFWKRGLFRKVHLLEILENLEILEFLENSQTVEKTGESDHFLEILESLEILEILEIPQVKRPLS